MDFDQAKQIGDVGEQRVARALDELQLDYGFVVLHDLLIARKVKRGKWITAQLDHVVFDQYGILVVETKVRTGALIKGSYTDSSWTACYPGGRNEVFQSPLRQNDNHVGLLQQLLKGRGAELSADGIRGLAVFVDANVSELFLDSFHEDRVIDVEQLRPYWERRHNFVGTNPLTQQETAELIRKVNALDESRNAEVVRAHAAYRQEGQPARGRQWHGVPYTPAPRSTPAAQPLTVGQAATHDPKPRTPAGSSAGSGPTESKLNYRVYAGEPADSGVNLGAEPRSGPTLRQVLLVALGIALVGFTIWAIASIATGTAPTWLWILIIVLALAFGGESKSQSRRRRSRSSYGAPRNVPFTQRLGEAVIALVVAVALLGGVYWFFLGGAFEHAIGSMGGVGFEQSSSAEAATKPQPTAPTLGQAQLALTEAAPDIAAKVTNITSPQVTSNPPYTTYTWDYIEQPDQRTAVVHQVSLSLTAEGEVWGVEIR